MEKSPAEEIKERDRINAIMRSFLKLESWTPAMGALLLCGMMPLRGSKAIPSEAHALDDQTRLAKVHELRGASDVLERWIDSTVDEGGTPEEAVALTVEPTAFLRWCYDEYENVAEWRKPSWLSSWYAYFDLSTHPDGPVPAPRPVITRAAALEGTADVLFPESTLESVVPVQSTAERKDEDYVNRLSKMIRSEKTRILIGEKIISALQKAEDPRKTATVWTALCELVKEQANTGELRYVSEGVLEIRNHKAGGWKEYSSKSFEQLLRRWSKEVN